MDKKVISCEFNIDTAGGQREEGSNPASEPGILSQIDGAPLCAGSGSD
ncbi:MAG: hypothetical protein ACI3XG_10430 [Faecousia sp.]